MPTAEEREEFERLRNAIPRIDHPEFEARRKAFADFVSTRVLADFIGPAAIREAT